MERRSKSEGGGGPEEREGYCEESAWVVSGEGFSNRCGDLVVEVLRRVGSDYSLSVCRYEKSAVCVCVGEKGGSA